MSDLHINTGGGAHYRREYGPCPVCNIADSAFLIAWPGNPYYAPEETCTNCGDSWCEGSLQERPFQRGWRQEAINRAVKLWDRACECPRKRDEDLYILPCEHERTPGAVPHAG